MVWAERPTPSSAFSRMSLRTRERLDLCDVVEDALEVESATSGAEGDPIRFIRPQRAYPVEGDHNLLKQVCLNLFANARTAVEGGGECRIEVRVGGSAAVLVAPVSASGTWIRSWLRG